MKKIGYFNFSDPSISTGISYANWGSRPYEYKWVIDIVKELNIQNLRVIDLGTGQPSCHSFPFYFYEAIKPQLYIGIDYSEDLLKEAVDFDQFKILHMDMSELKFEDKKFNLGMCISTYEHLENKDKFLQSIKETHRVLEDNSYLIITLDEIWDAKNINSEYHPWNILELDLIKNGFDSSEISFGLCDFLDLIKDYFEPVDNNIPKKQNADPSILHNSYWNSGVSFCLLKKK